MSLQSLFRSFSGDTRETGVQLRDLMLGWGGFIDLVVDQLISSEHITPEDRHKILDAAGITVDDLLRRFAKLRIPMLDAAGTVGAERNRVLCEFGGLLMQLGFVRDASIVSRATKLGFSDEDAAALTSCMVEARTRPSVD